MFSLSKAGGQRAFSRLSSIRKIGQPNRENVFTGAAKFLRTGKSALSVEVGAALPHAPVQPDQTISCKHEREECPLFRLAKPGRTWHIVR
jgi:hypothetical protein